MKNQGGARCLLKQIKERKQTGLFLSITIGEISVSFCRGSRVKGKMSRVEGKMSRVEGKMSRVEGLMSRVEGRMSRVEGTMSRVRKCR